MILLWVLEENTIYDLTVCAQLMPSFPPKLFTTKLEIQKHSKKAAA